MYKEFSSINLDGVWDVAGFEYGKGNLDTIALDGQCEMIPCKVPGDIHNALVDADIIGDPLLLDHAEKYLYTENMEWWYKKIIVIPEIHCGYRYELYFGGLDLNAEIYVNGSLAGKAVNAFIPHSFDVTELLKEGNNVLIVKIDCGLKSIADNKEINKYDTKLKYEYEQDFRRLYLRKPQFSFRWDWAPRLLTTGIWRHTELRKYKTAQIANIYAYDIFGDDGVTLAIDTQIKVLDTNRPLNIEIQVEKKDFIKTVNTPLKLVNEIHSVKLRIVNPELWYPNGYGSQPLYNINVRLFDGANLLSEEKIRHGIRKVELKEDLINEEEGKQFAISVNGLPVFSKGANWVPADSIPANVTYDKYRELIYSAKDANFNMLRVWGGGCYENKCFYDLCDETGILVWQDFMFANGYYPDDNAELMDTIQDEIVTVIKQLRNHACVAIWCGNNEINWGWQSLFVNIERFFGKNIYDEIIPAALAAYDGLRPYRLSCPSSIDDAENNSRKEGDTHSWDFWLPEDIEKATDFTQFSNDKSKFCSEYGVMSHPNYASLREYLGTDSESVVSEKWVTHNNTCEFGKIKLILEKYYSKDVSAFGMKKLAHFSQYMQGDIYRYANEHFRRRKPNCMGVLFWMYNDCWGTTGWSIIDYYLRKKVSYYMVKQSYSPIISSISRHKNTIEVFLINDTASVVENAVMNCGFIDFYGKILWQQGRQVNIPTDRAELAVTTDVSELPDGNDATNAYFYSEILDKDKKILYRGTCLLTDLKDISLPKTDIDIKSNLVTVNNKKALLLQSNCYILSAVLEADGVDFEDNGFDIEPGIAKTVYYSGNLDVKKLTVHYLN